MSEILQAWERLELKHEYVEETPQDIIIFCLKTSAENTVSRAYNIDFGQGNQCLHALVLPPYTFQQCDITLKTVQCLFSKSFSVLHCWK